MHPPSHPIGDLLEELDREGFRLRLDGDRLAIYPVARLTVALRQSLQCYKADLVELVRLFGPSALLALFSDRPHTEAERALLAEKATELQKRLPKAEKAEP